MSATLVTDAALLAALATAHSIRFSAYVLNVGTVVERALESAAARGARVDVVLDGSPYRSARGILRANAAAQATLTRHGARVRITTATEPAMHLKAAVVDGVAYLDDRNWASGDRDTIVALDDFATVIAVSSALAQQPVKSDSLPLEKQAALVLEARTIYEAAGDHIDVETESFGATIVSKALAFRAGHGTHVRLLVAQAELRGAAGIRERHVLAKLAAVGVEIEETSNTEKLCVAGDEAWIGSANATFSPEASADWGMRTYEPDIVSGIACAFERNWSGGHAPSIV